MKKAKTRAQRRRVAMLRKVLLTLTLVMVVAMVTVGGTIAWITDKSGAVTNTFTVGDINIDLKEQPYKANDNKLDESITKEAHWQQWVTSISDYKMIPGRVLPKNPTVKVDGGSEACWLFVKVQETNNPAAYMTYSVDTSANEWTALEGEAGVYYREVEASTANQFFTILTDNQVTVKYDVTKEQLNAIGNNKPVLTFTAYAVQKENVTSAADAWAKANP
ncbi:MAG: hypothetical protein IJ347_09800 [Faecalibacterium sp.]|nr:hypothetical protein [Faecalibacterium sp.]